ncbi:amidohydrolase [Flagellimonas beolgyonensis]|uniref:amidohydrolase n=1 Tax=Flagellimonas beolgyonensis TaxID=864064 RepID=UPI003D659E7D
MSKDAIIVRPEIFILRKELHAHPELSGLEHGTKKRIQKFVAEHGPSAKVLNLGETGFALVYEFPEKGKTIAIRCELDALPIQEINTFSHKSQTNGVSHKCGHDGHMAIVSGLLFWLESRPNIQGKVVLLFQPAEETGKGAENIVTNETFKALNIDYLFALHNIPKEPLHSIILPSKGFSAEVISLIISLKGKESHASEPENGINPALALSQIILEMEPLNVTDPKKKDFSLLTPVHILMGEKAYGISPAHAELHYTLRTWNNKQMELLKTNVLDIVERICAQYGLEHAVEWLEYFPASSNAPECCTAIKEAAKEHNLTFVEKPHPFKFGEDFGWYAKTYKCAMFGLGAGINTPALHNADYDFPDKIIETGIALFISIIRNLLTQD